MVNSMGVSNLGTQGCQILVLKGVTSWYSKVLNLGTREEPKWMSTSRD